MVSQQSNENGDKSPDDIVFEVFEQRMKAALVAEEAVDREAQKVADRTNRISQLSLWACILLTPFLFFLIFSLVLDMGVITDRMGAMQGQVAQMREDFQAVSENVDAIDQAVVNMAGNVSVVPRIDDRVAGMSRDFVQINRSMGGITPDVLAIDHTLGLMNRDMAQMNHLFGAVNQNLFMMRRDVNTMTNPVRMFPFFGQ